MKEQTIVQAINECLRTEMKASEKVLCLGEDIGVNGGVFRVTDGLQAEFGDNRVIDTPLAEAAIIGTAVGMAARGLRPVAEIQFFGFIFEAMDQMAAQVARLRFRTAGAITLPLVIRAPYGGGVNTPELHSDSLESLFLHTPGLKVVMPSTPRDAKGLLKAAIDDPDPVLFLEPMSIYRSIKEMVEKEVTDVSIGKLRYVTRGEYVTLITWGPPVHRVEKVVKQFEAKLEEDNVVEIIDLRTISPLDRDGIIESVKKTGRVVIVHEAVKTGGVGAEISALINEHALFYLHAPIIRVAGYDTPYPVPSVEHAWLPTEKRIEQALKDVLKEE